MKLLKYIIFVNMISVTVISLVFMIEIFEVFGTTKSFHLEPVSELILSFGLPIFVVVMSGIYQYRNRDKYLISLLISLSYSIIGLAWAFFLIGLTPFPSYYGGEFGGPFILFFLQFIGTFLLTVISNFYIFLIFKPKKFNNKQ